MSVKKYTIEFTFNEGQLSHNRVVEGFNKMELVGLVQLESDCIIASLRSCQQIDTETQEAADGQ